MNGSCQGLSEPWNSRGTWTWGMLGSLVVHAVIVVAVVTVFQGRPSRPRVVVPVETVTLVPRQPGSKGGGGGRPAPMTSPQPTLSPVQAKPHVKPQLRPKVKPVPPPPEPTKAPVIPIPAPPSINTKAPPAPSSAITSQARASLGTAGVSDSGRGGQGGGRGTGSGGGMGPGQGRGSGSGSPLQGYLKEVRRLLEKQKDYPLMARRRQLQGVVVLRFIISCGGQIESSQVSRASGHAILDEAARDTIRRVGRFPPFPAELNRQDLTIEIPLAFRLSKD